MTRGRARCCITNDHFRLFLRACAAAGAVELLVLLLFHITQKLEGSGQLEAVWGELVRGCSKLIRGLEGSKNLEGSTKLEGST